MKLLNFKVKGSLEWLGGLITGSLFSPLGVLFLGSLNQNLGWGPILVSLQVPELTIEEFLQVPVPWQLLDSLRLLASVSKQRAGAKE